MATKKHNLSQFDSPLPSAAEMRFGIVVAEWNREVTEALLEGAVRTLRAAGCPDLNIQIKYVPGTFELALGAQFFAEYTDVDAVIALGCVIQGDTRHFDFICQGVTQGITQLQIQWNMQIGETGSNQLYSRPYEISSQTNSFTNISIPTGFNRR